MSVTMATVLAPFVYDFYYLFKISFSNELQILSGGGGDRVGRCNCAVVGCPTNFDRSRRA